MEKTQFSKIATGIYGGLATMLMILIVLASFHGCRQDDMSDDMIEITLFSEPVFVGENMPVQLTFPGPGEYEVSATLSLYDSENGFEQDAQGQFLIGDEPIIFPYHLTVPASRRVDFAVSGLDAGTYKVRFTISRISDERSLALAAISVIKSKPGSDDPDNPGDDPDPDDPGSGGGGGGGKDPDPDQPSDKKISDFTIPSVDPTYKYVCIEAGGQMRFTPVVTPTDVTGVEFQAVSSNEEIAEVTIEDGVIVVKGKYPGYCNISITPANATGPTKTFPLLIYKDVRVEVDFYELNATEEEIKTKTFPVYLRFSSDCDLVFPTPIQYAITMKAVVSATGQDTKSITDKTDVKFYGKNRTYYNITERVLIPASNLLKTSNYTLRLTLSVGRSSSLDTKLWRITYVDTFVNQEARIKEYITEIQQ